MSSGIRRSPFSIVPVEAALDHRLGVREYRVLIALLSFRGRNSDTVYPWRASIASRCGYSEQQVSKATTKLVEFGWLVKVGNGGRNRPAQYRPSVPESVTDPDTLLDVAPPPDSGEAQPTDLSEYSEGEEGAEEAAPESVTDPDTLSADEVQKGVKSGLKRVQGSDTRKDQTQERKTDRESARAAEQPLDAARIRKILLDRGFEHQQVLGASARRLTTELREQHVTESEFRQAIEWAEAKTAGRPDSPLYYRWAINRVIEQRGQTADASDHGNTEGDNRDDLYRKDYTRGATAPGELPAFLRTG